MFLKKTGDNYDINSPIKLNWNECLFVDIWNKYYLYSECGTTTFSFRLERYLGDRRRESSHFNENYIQLIQSGRFSTK
jgi:hypothetical protein